MRRPAETGGQVDPIECSNGWEAVKKKKKKLKIKKEKEKENNIVPKFVFGIARECCHSTNQGNFSIKLHQLRSFAC